MTAGYAAFQTNLKIKGTSGISSNWDIKITNVTKSNETGGVEEVKTPTWTDLTAYMEANLYEKGDSIEYDVTVQNDGTIDASLDNISENIKSTNEAVKITFSGYTKGEKLFKNSSQIIKVKIEYNPDFTGTPEEGSGEISVDLNYTQAEGGTITPTDKYLVTYDCMTNGGKDCANLNEYKSTGENINLSNTATKDGFEFIGWNTSKDATEGLTKLNMLNENVTLYAIFKDTIPPECEITVTEVTINDVTLKANCTDASGIKEYNFKNGEENNIQTENTFKLNDYKLSEIIVEATDKVNNKGTYKISDDNLQKAYQQIYEILTTGHQRLLKKQENLLTNILDRTYPVGSIYITTDGTNPSETIGGTWEEYGKGKTLIGVDTSDTNFNTVNKTGGSKTSTLAVTNLPSHTHSIPALSGTAASAGAHTHTRGTMNIGGTFQVRGLMGGADNVMGYTGAFSRTVDNWSGAHSVLSTKSVNPATRDTVTFDASKNWTGATLSNGAHTHTVTTKASNTDSIGSGTSFTNLQPYITVYIYKRTS